MKNLRKYGTAPFNAAVIHGGPGAGGEMAPVARELAISRGVLEPIQTATSLEGQVEELRTILEQNGEPPFKLIGFSWGAWLGFIFAARYPLFVKKIILVGSGPYEAKYAVKIQETRLKRLDESERIEARACIEDLNDPAAEVRNRAFARLGALLSKADAYDPLPHGSEAGDWQVDIFHSVWEDAAALRSSGNLLELGKHIHCPVVAIHGDYDPHPAEGVKQPLSGIVKSFRFILLKNCGHMPWIERQAKVKFFEILNKELC